MAFGIGLILSFIIAFPAYRKKALTFSGFIAALILGALLYYAGSFLAFSTMIVFFITSSLLSKLSGDKVFDQHIVAKGSCRDHIQVLANGIVPLTFAFLYKFSSNEIFFLSIIIAFACANADTWASEVGSQSDEIPHYIIKRQPVTIGLSGGVTKAGFLASFIGSGIISLWYILFISIKNGFEIKNLILFLIIAIFGFIGSLIDSILGELAQAKYISWKDENRITELAIEDSKENRIISGLKWVDNNLVNFISALSSALLGLLILYFI